MAFRPVELHERSAGLEHFVSRSSAGRMRVAEVRASVLRVLVQQQAGPNDQAFSPVPVHRHEMFQRAASGGCRDWPPDARQP